MNKPLFLVLEDAPVRVKWLRYAFPDCEIEWATNVTDFLKLAQDPVISSRVTLVFMDHDLGISCYEVPAMDGHGDDNLNGYDAACFLTIQAPVLVWSVNEHRAPKMVLKLRERGYQALWTSFNDTAHIEKVVKAFLLIKSEAEREPCAVPDTLWKCQ